ncbi:epoxidase LasC [Mycolicibacterium fortuitum]|uniref:Epoxidase LasC n=1 Tax=Mycolicibacterium fortuitum TaxID=1766 RepID=A0A378USF7_MYCFO|nr:epoxidase LasC [Mycolicibacterium fortuitum]
MTGLRDATPVGQISISRSTAAAWRRYDRISQLPDGLVVVGDALCNLNPLHGQGMTMAALQALALRDCLRSGRSDIPRRFYRLAAEQVAPVWAANRAHDRAAPGDTRGSRRHRIRSWAQHAALNAAANDIVVAERLFRVRGMIDPPTRLQEPALLLRILLSNLRHPRHGPARRRSAEPPLASLPSEPRIPPAEPTIRRSGPSPPLRWDAPTAASAAVTARSVSPADGATAPS